MPATNTQPTVAQIAIKVDGTDLAPDVIERLEYAVVETSLALPSMFVLRFHDDRAELIDSATFDFGKVLTVSVKSGSSLTQLMSGEITAIEPDFDTHTASLTIRGYDKRHRLTYGTHTRTFVNATDSDIVQQIAQQSGLQVQATATTTVHEHVFQDNQSNLAFIQDRALRNGFGVYMEDNKLVFGEFKQGTEVTLKWGESLQSFSPRVSVVGQVNQVIVRGWDAKQKQAIVGQKTTSDSHPVIGYGKWGGQVLQTAFSAGVFTELRRSLATQSEAEKIAQGILDSTNAGFIEAEGVAFGNPTLTAGAKAVLESVGTKFSGKYIVSFTRHIYEKGTYMTEFRVQGNQPQMLGDLLQNTSNKLESWQGVVVALVTNCNDPEDRGRVKVKYPWLSDELESGWVRVAMVGAGNGRGLYWLPEVNDEVLVAFENGDINRPFVIGSLYNGRDAVPEATAHENGKIEKRTMKTRAGHIIRLTDTSGSEMIEIIDAKNKTSVTMDTASDKITIKSGTDIMIEGTNGSITLKSNNITLEGTGKIEIKGQTGVDVTSSATMNLKANAPLKVESTAITEIKGSMVKVN